MTWDGEHAYGWSSQHESDLNRLKGIRSNRLSVSPQAADVAFRVAAERVVSGTEVTGRIIGPRCLYRETDAKVSPVRSVIHTEGGQTLLIARTSFPTPAFWEP